MTRSEIKQGLIGILSSKDILGVNLDASTINDETSLKNNLKMDSLRMLNLLVAVENHFKIVVNPQNLTMKDFDRFSSLVEYIENSLKAA